MNDSIDVNDLPSVKADYPVQQGGAMPVALQILLDDNLYKRVSDIAARMAKAVGITPAHLIDQPEACFAVTVSAITWRLDPFAVARATYTMPNGQIGYLGALVNAIVEQSGRLEPATGGVRFEHTGDWTQIDGKFAIRESQKQDKEGKPKKYAAPTWTHEDAVKSKAGITIRARLRGESEDREFSMLLSQAFPLNSTLWATDPRTQLVYLATRRFANVRMPSVMMGFPDPYANEGAREIDMGDAVQVERNIKMPQAQEPQQETRSMSEGSDDVTTPPRVETASSYPSGSTVDKETGEVQGQQPPGLIQAGALKVINSNLADRELREKFCKAFGVADPSELAMSKVNDAMSWIAANKPK